MYVPYAPHVADLLQVLQQAFTAAAKALGHDIEKGQLYRKVSYKETFFVCFVLALYLIL